MVSVPATLTAAVPLLRTPVPKGLILRSIFESVALVEIAARIGPAPVTFQTMWSASATDAGTGGFTLAGVGIANNADYDTAFGTVIANTALAASTTQDDLMINVESGAVTIASAADSTNTIFRLVRNTAVDTNTGDLRLVGVKIFYTTNAANDA